MEYTFKDGTVATIRSLKFGDILDIQKMDGGLDGTDGILNILSKTCTLSNGASILDYIRELDFSEGAEFIKAVSAFIMPAKQN